MRPEEEEMNTNVQSLDTDYIQAIKDLKSNSVSKEDYQKMVEENKKLINSLTNGNFTQQQEEVVKPTTQELRDMLFNNKKQLSNLEYCTAALQLRENILEEEGKDIFVANNDVYTAGQDSYESADRVARVMAECIEYADGNSEAFTNELMRRTNDVVIPGRR